MSSRPSTLAAALLVVLACTAVLTLLDASRLRRLHAADVATQVGLVERLGLSDLALFTEARYTRHRALADLHSPFQDHPFSLEHFPSGSLMPPPAHLTRDRHEAVDRQAALPR